MSRIIIRDVRNENIVDLCRLCVPAEKRTDPKFMTGMEQKRAWVLEMLRLWGGCAKLAYAGPAAAGFIQYEPVPREGIVRIHCIYVPEEGHWRKGIAKQLLSNLLDEMKEPKAWYGHMPPHALVTRTFPGEKPGQFSAHDFFVKEGFKQVGEDPEHLSYPLQSGYIYQPPAQEKIEFIPQKEDMGKAVIIHGPSFCPFSFAFLKLAEQAIKEIAAEISVRWIDKSLEPEEFKKRGHFEGCIVNAIPIRSFVLDTESFRKEVSGALNAGNPDGVRTS